MDAFSPRQPPVDPALDQCNVYYPSSGHQHTGYVSQPQQSRYVVPEQFIPPQQNSPYNPSLAPPPTQAPSAAGYTTQSPWHYQYSDYPSQGRDPFSPNYQPQCEMPTSSWQQRGTAMGYQQTRVGIQSPNYAPQPTTTNHQNPTAHIYPPVAPFASPRHQPRQQPQMLGASSCWAPPASATIRNSLPGGRIPVYRVATADDPNDDQFEFEVRFNNLQKLNANFLDSTAR